MDQTPPNISNVRAETGAGAASVAPLGLTSEARRQLREILISDYGEDVVEMDECALDELGMRLLRLTALVLRRGIDE